MLVIVGFGRMSFMGMVVGAVLPGVDMVVAFFSRGVVMGMGVLVDVFVGMDVGVLVAMLADARVFVFMLVFVRMFVGMFVPVFMVALHGASFFPENTASGAAV